MQHLCPELHPVSQKTLRQPEGQVPVIQMEPRLFAWSWQEMALAPVKRVAAATATAALTKLNCMFLRKMSDFAWRVKCEMNVRLWLELVTSEVGCGCWIVHQVLPLFIRSGLINILPLETKDSVVSRKDGKTWLQCGLLPPQPYALKVMLEPDKRHLTTDPIDSLHFFS